MPGATCSSGARIARSHKGSIRSASRSDGTRGKSFRQRVMMASWRVRSRMVRDAICGGPRLLRSDLSSNGTSEVGGLSKVSRAASQRSRMPRGTSNHAAASARSSVATACRTHASKERHAITSARDGLLAPPLSGKRAAGRRPRAGAVPLTQAADLDKPMSARSLAYDRVRDAPASAPAPGRNRHRVALSSRRSAIVE